jgi:hypothetical protein
MFPHTLIASVYFIFIGKIEFTKKIAFVYILPRDRNHVSVYAAYTRKHTEYIDTAFMQVCSKLPIISLKVDVKVNNLLLGFNRLCESERIVCSHFEEYTQCTIRSVDVCLCACILFVNSMHAS